jgi:hypothetical protein
VNLLVLLLALFPDARIANLPTGRALEDAGWQFQVSHRFYSPVVDSGRGHDLLGFLATPSVAVELNRRLSRTFAMGVKMDVTQSVGLQAEYSPLGYLHVRAEAYTLFNAIRRDNTWLSAGPLIPFTRRNLFLVAFPRLTTNTKSHVASVGIGAKYDLGNGLSLGAEAEPVLYASSDVTRGKLAWNLAFEKEIGWHNFTLTVGNTYAQLVPYSFTAADLDITKARFRVGFNILRKF